MTDRAEIGRASREEVDLLTEWAAQEGWNPGLGDAACFHAADPDGFWVARIGGAPVAGMSLVSYGDDFAFLGFYIVRPDMRGRGIGYALWQTALARCRARTVGLDGVVDQQENYRKSGFELAHRNLRFGGRFTAPAPALYETVRITPEMLAAVAACDALCFPVSRPAFLGAWLAAQGHVGHALMEGDRVTGYGVIRACRDGFKIGPLFAPDAQAARSLFSRLAEEARGAMLYIDPPEPNAAAVAMCRDHGLAPVFETARMYRGPAPALPLDHVFGITTFELG